MRVIWIAAVLSAAGSMGCASISSMQTASALGAGDIRAFVAPEIGSVPMGTLATGPGLLLEGGVRVGVGAGIDVGVKLQPEGYGADAKVELYNGPNAVLSAGLGFSKAHWVLGDEFSQSGTFDSMTFHLPILLGLKAGAHEVILGPRFAYSIASASNTYGVPEGTARIGSAGFTAGIAFAATPWLRLMPEVTVLIPVWERDVITKGNANTNGQSSAFELGFGVLFGN